MRNKLAHLFLALTLICQIGFSPRALAQLNSNDPAKPKLVVLIVADQFRYDFLARYADKFGPGGFRYLMDNGANFTNCKYGQACTHTAVGHSVISTGAYPWATGIIANQWYDRRKGKEMLAVAEDNLQLIGANGPSGGTRPMNGSTIGDQLKISTQGRSKVFTVSLKDRAALFLAGRLANAAFWWDTRTGSFVSSSQYGQALPNWVQAFNDQHTADKYFGKTWQRLLPETEYTASSRDDYAWEKPIPGDGRKFPHVMTGGAASPGEEYYKAFSMTPWANDMLFDFAKRAVEVENLGRHAEPDFLAISLSAGDNIGHAFGPMSQENEDIVLQMDKGIAGLLDQLDAKVGLDKCMIVFTADHGIMDIPEFLKEKGMDAGRIDPKAFKTMLDNALDARLGSDDWVESFEPPNLYLNFNAIDKQKYRQPDVEALAAKLARSIPGIGDIYTAAQFFTNQLPVGPNAKAVEKSYYLGRSGELYILTKPGFIFSSESSGTTHGSPYNYDSQVPLIMVGPTVKAGRFSTTVSPADIAATLCSVLSIDAPSLSQGRALSEALVDVMGPPKPRK